MVRRSIACDECKRNCKMVHLQKNDQSPIIARFFKIIFGKNCSKFLCLPPRFASEVNHLVNQQIYIEDSGGQRWSVTLHKDAEGTLVFQKGWQKFFLDHNLEEGEFMVFNYLKGGNHFIVQIYETSACERTNFNNGRRPPNKRSRRDPETDSLCKPSQRAFIDVTDKPSSDSSAVAGAGLENANFESLQFLSRSIGMEEPNYLIERDDRHRGEGMNILYDLSIFEMGNIKQNEKKNEGALDTVISHSHREVIECADEYGKAIGTKVNSSHAESAEKSKTNGDDTQMPVIHTTLADGNSGEFSTGNFNNGPYTKLAPSQTMIAEQFKIMGHVSHIAVDHTDEIRGSPGGIFVTKFEKDSGFKPCPSHAENTGKTKTKIDGTANHAHSVNGHSSSILSYTFHTKPSDDSILRKDMPNNVLNFQNGCGKIAGRENTMKQQCFDSSISSSLLKHPIETGKYSVKKEVAELKQESAGCPLSYCDAGKEPITYGKRPAVVKIEPDVSCDRSVSDAFSPFSAEVNSLSYLELPMDIPIGRGRREQGRSKIVILKDSAGRTWPFLYPDAYPKFVLIGKWREFCELNHIKIGDKCRVEAENEMVRICRVDVAD